MSMQWDDLGGDADGLRRAAGEADANHGVYRVCIRFLGLFGRGVEETSIM